MNTNGNWDSADVLLFYAARGDPVNASRIDYCHADVDGDGYISVRDETCFLAAVAAHHAPMCSGLCWIALDDYGEDRPSQPGGEGGGQPDYQALLALLQAWDAANPRGDYPSLTDEQYQSMRYHEMADIGMISFDVADGMDAFMAWKAANPRAAHPELSPVQWGELVAAAYQMYVASVEGGSP